MNLKICGLKKYINNKNIGFIIYNKSKNYFKKKIIKINKNIFFVFVNPSVNLLKNKSDRNIIDFIQLHGNENLYFFKISNNFKKSFKVFFLKKIFNSSKYFLETYNKKYGGASINIKKKKNNNFLCGNINVFNLKYLKCYCLDISRGIEFFKKKNYFLINITKQILKNV
ncbi:phosphoribosylanthranilate isomerase [Candidatus Vidania fulgoroideorum]